MPKQITQEELDAIVNIVARFPEGASLGEIVENLKIPISRRNVQHRLIFSRKRSSPKRSGKSPCKVV